jgi:hypothetical protein
MKRLLPFFAFVLLGAQFAGFTVQPKGNQDFNPLTGVTTLPQGGTLIDATDHLILQAPYISYKQGSFFEAQQATMKGPKALFQAAFMKYQVASQELRMRDLVYSSKDFPSIQAQEGLAFLKQGYVVLKGKIISKKPSIQAESAVIDTNHHHVLLIGPFIYRQGAEVARGNRANSLLLITFEGGKFLLTSQVPPALLHQMEAYSQQL